MPDASWPRAPTPSCSPPATRIGRCWPPPRPTTPGSTRPSRRRRPMWGEAGVAEEDALDREQAKWVMRRAAAMLRPYRREVIVSSVLMVLWTASTIAGPLFVRYGIDHGISAGSTRG